MTPAGLAALGLLFAGIVIATRRWRACSWIAGLVGFTVLLVGSWSLPLGQRAILGDEVLVSTGYLRLVLMLAAASGGTLTFVGAATGGNRGVPALALLWSFAMRNERADAEQQGAVPWITANPWKTAR